MRLENSLSYTTVRYDTCNYTQKIFSFYVPYGKYPLGEKYQTIEAYDQDQKSPSYDELFVNTEQDEEFHRNFSAKLRQKIKDTTPEVTHGTRVIATSQTKKKSYSVKKRRKF